MSPRNLLHLALTLVLLGLVVGLVRWDKDRFLLARFARTVSAELTASEANAEAWVSKNQAALAKIAHAVHPPEPTDSLEIFEEDKNYTVLLGRADTLLFWSNSRILPDKLELKRLAALPERVLVELGTGQYLAARRSFEGCFLTTLIPVRFNLPQDYGRNMELFPADKTIPDQIHLSSEKQNDFPVVSQKTAIGWLESEGKIRYAPVQWWTVVLGLFFLLSYFLLVNSLSMRVSKRVGTRKGSLVLLLGVGLIVFLNIQFDLTGQLDALTVFSQKFEQNWLGNSLGEWLLYMSVLLWLMVFFHRSFMVRPWGELPITLQISLGVIYILAMMMSLLMGILVLRQLVFYSNINFDFDNILNLDRFAVFAVCGIVLLLAGLFLFSHRMMNTVLASELTKHQRMFALLIAAAILLPFCAEGGLYLRAFQVIAVCMAYVVTFDFFIGNKSPGFGWIMCWLVVFSLSSAYLLYEYRDQHDSENRRFCAKELAEPRDSTVAEPLLDSLQRQLAHDLQVDLRLRPVQFDTAKAYLESYLAKQVYRKNYLFQHYRMEVFAFDTTGRGILTDQAADAHELVAKRTWAKAKPLANPELRWGFDSLFNVQYILHKRALRNNEAKFPADVFIVFTHEYEQQGKVYSELFFNQPFKRLRFFKNYDFAIFHDGKVVVRNGSIPDSLCNPANFPPVGVAQEFTPKNLERTDMVYAAPNHFTVIIGRHIGGNWKPLYLFSSLFTLLSIFMIVLALVNTYVIRVLPDYYQFYITIKGSLAKRIQYFTVGLIVIAFLVIGFLTYRNFDTGAQQSEMKRLEYRTRSMLKSLTVKTLNVSPQPDSLRRQLVPSLAELAHNLSTDVHLFALNGDLLFTTQRDAQHAGLLPQKMNPQAWAALRTQDITEILETDISANRSYSAKYATLRNRAGNAVAFVGSPYYLSDAGVSAELSDFLGILASVYVMLLIVAGTLTFMVARSIIKPIELIADEIKKLRLEDKNKPLEYLGDGQDELSTLIDEYNVMVAKMEDSKERMKKLERDAAWREMAKNISHDIKTALTPLKMPLQQLERLISADMEDARRFLKSTIGRLIVQIDLLAHIATEFHLFAKMELRKEEMLLNRLVDNVFGLYHDMGEMDFQTHVPDTKFWINGDHNHLMRVFNNLMANAQQAIPSERRGLIRVDVYREGEYVLVHVGDNGSGIPPEVSEKIFEPNFTTKSTGSGLGLSICKKILEGHDGDIWFTTLPNVGTDFYVKLPLLREE